MKETRKFQWRPGVVTELTRYAAEGAWIDGDHVRFKVGLPEKIGGWQDVNSSVSFRGVGREITDWADFNLRKRVILGSHKGLFVWDGDEHIHDITPIVSTVTITSALGTSTDSRIIRVCVANAASTGDFVEFTSMAATIASNVHLSGVYIVVSASTNAFTVSVGATAAAATTGAGSVTVNFLLPTGNQGNLAATSAGTGWGGSSWGSGPWGGSSGLVGTNLLRQWSLDLFGEDPLANPRRGSIYKWNTSAGVSTRAFIVTAAPSICNFIVMSPENRQLVAMGCSDEVGVYDPLLVRWSDAEDLDDWVASAGNQAGSQRIDGANEIVGALRTRGGILLWTDDTLHSMTFQGPPLFFDFQLLGGACGLIAPHAAVEGGGRIYWMSQDKFMVFDGAVRVLPCDVHHHVFDNIEQSQRQKTFAALNSEHNEVWWFYQDSNSTDDCNRYVAYDFVQNLWHYGSMERSIWTDARIYDSPIAADVSGHLYYQEVGWDADGSAMSAYIESADFDLDDGHQLMFIDRLICDTSVSGGSYAFTIKTRKYPSGSQTSKGPFTITAATTKVDFRARGRQASVRFASDGAGVSWHLGAPRLRLKADGEQ